MDEKHRSPTAHSRLVLLLAKMDEQLLRMEREYQLSVEVIAKCKELGMINPSLNDDEAASDLKQLQAMSGVCTTTEVTTHSIQRLKDFIYQVFRNFTIRFIFLRH
jgi:hypothetical protein